VIRISICAPPSEGLHSKKLSGLLDCFSFVPLFRSSLYLGLNAAPSVIPDSTFGQDIKRAQLPLIVITKKEAKEKLPAHNTPLHLLAFDYFGKLRQFSSYYSFPGAPG